MIAHMSAMQNLFPMIFAYISHNRQPGALKLRMSCRSTQKLLSVKQIHHTKKCDPISFLWLN